MPDAFPSLFYRTLISNGSMYCIAEAEEVRRETLERLQLCGAPVDENADDVNIEDTLTVHQKRRLQDWLAYAKDEGVSSGFVNLAQNVEFLTRSSSHRPIHPWAPTLLKSTILYSLDLGRVASDHRPV